MATRVMSLMRVDGKRSGVDALLNTVSGNVEGIRIFNGSARPFQVVMRDGGRQGHGARMNAGTGETEFALSPPLSAATFSWNVTG